MQLLKMMMMQKNADKFLTAVHLKMQFLLLLAGMMGFGENAFAQDTAAGSAIRGRVVDSLTNKPLPAVTIQLKTGSGITVKTGVTTTDGSFVFAIREKLNYVIQMSAVGYAAKRMVVDCTDSSKQTWDLGIIPIHSKAGTLGNVIVKAIKPLIKQEADRISYDLEADPESKSSNVLEMMRKIPFLSVDGDDNILLNGSRSYKILINGKPSGMMESNPKEVLRSIPASTIIRIEVITSPSSKYDAEGLAGIINIITRKNIDNGYNGTLNFNYRSPFGGPGAGGFFGFKQGKFGMSVLAGASRYEAPQNSSFNNRVTKGDTGTNLDQNSSRESRTRTAYVGAEFSYEPDSLHLISAQFNTNGSSGKGLTNQHTLLRAGRSVMQQYDVNNHNTDKGEGTDLSLNYQLGFKASKERLLTFSYRYLQYRNHQLAALDILNAVNFTNPDYRQANEGSASEHTLQADYVHTVKKVTIEAGIKAIWRSNSSDFQYQFFDSAKGNFVPDPARTNTYRNGQDVLAAYNTYQFAIKSWGFKAGLRIEQTRIDADFISGASQVKQQYSSVIPAAVINKKLKDRSSLNISFTNRIQRPGINQLNPFIDRSNPAFESAGNPALKPAFTHVFQLSYLKSGKVTVNLSAGCMLISDLIGSLADYDSATGITRTVFQNIGKARVLKTNFYLNYPVTKNGSIRLNSDIRYVSGEVRVRKGIIKNAGWNSYLNVSGSYRFDKGWRLNADLTLNSGGTSSVQATSNGFTSSSINVQKDFEKSKFTLSASVNNPVTRYRHKREEMWGTDFMQLNTSDTYYRSFAFSLNYRFGKLKNAVKKNKRGITNDDSTD